MDPDPGGPNTCGSGGSGSRFGSGSATLLLGVAGGGGGARYRTELSLLPKNRSGSGEVDSEGTFPINFVV